MGQRTPPMRRGTSSRARSVEAYYPWYPPPVFPEGLEKNSYAGFTDNPPAASSPIERAPVVRRNNFRYGDVTLYNHGPVAQHPFHMRATGQVESSMFQTLENMPNVVQFNMWLYRAAKGYPRNLGLSEKVPTLPQEALGNSPYNMQPAPRLTRTVFTRRAYSSAPSVPAKPTGGWSSNPIRGT